MFSIGDDEIDVDLDDEEFLLAACGIPSDNTKLEAVPNSSVGISISSSESKEFHENTDSLAHFSSLNRNKVPKSFENGIKNQESTLSCLNNDTRNKTVKTFEFNYPNQGRNFGPPSKKIALSRKDSYKSSSFGKSDILNLVLPKDPVESFHAFPKPLYNNYNNEAPIVSISNFNNSPSTNNYKWLNIANSRSSSQCKAVFQTPDQSHSKEAKCISPRNKETKSCSNDFDITPSRRKSARKFPGPAGLLPKLDAIQSLGDLSNHFSPVPSRLSPNNLQRPLSTSQSQAPIDDEEFTREPWTGMFNEYKQNVPAFMRYTVLQAISEAASQRLKYGKVPSLCVLVKTSSTTESDFSIFLKDPTGEICGTLHKKILDEYPSELGPGAGIILKQVSVFSPSPRKHYLNITPGNIIHIYPPNQTQTSSSQVLASQGTQQTQPVNTRQEHRASVYEPEISLEKTFTSSGDSETKGEGHQDLQNFNDLLEGLEDEDEVLDSDLLAMCYLVHWTKDYVCQAASTRWIGTQY